MDKKKNIVEICVYIVIILVFIFGMIRLHNLNAGVDDMEVPVIEMPQYNTTDAERVQ